MFLYSDTNKRYHTFDFHLKHKFGGKVLKLSLNAGFTCPNIDGSKGRGGCTYCSPLGSGDFAGTPLLSLREQFEQQKAIYLAKYPQARYLAYFQAHTNTYAPLEKLRLFYEEVLGFEGVVGLCIATRADCFSDDIADYLAELSRRTYLIVELGLQTIHDVTGDRINRCHSYQEFLSGFSKLKERGIPVCVHLINGLPGESREMMLESASAVAGLGAHSVKLHLLHVLAGTKIAEQYQNGEFELLTQKEYVSIVCDQIELFPPELVIQRITGDGDKKTLLGPLWSLNKLVVMNAIDKELAYRNSAQGRNFR